MKRLLIKKAEKLTLYHGTDREPDFVKENGLLTRDNRGSMENSRMDQTMRDVIYLSNDEFTSSCYGKYLYTVSIDSNNLIPDEDIWEFMEDITDWDDDDAEDTYSIENPITGEETIVSEEEYNHLKSKGQGSGMKCLELMGTCAHVGDISPEQIIDSRES